MQFYYIVRKLKFNINKENNSKYIPKHYDTPTNIGIKWQIDVKVVPKQCYTGQLPDKFYQYTVIDEASRERFIYPYKEQSSYSTIDFVKRAIVYFKYKPKTIQTDNGTFQGRLVQELKIDGITDINKANDYLVNSFIPNFNKHFALNY